LCNSWQKNLPRPDVNPEVGSGSHAQQTAQTILRFESIRGSIRNHQEDNLMATCLVTGVAGFIAAKVAEFLLADGHAVVGVDNLNDAYDVRLKQWRLAQLEGRPGFEFHRLDIGDRHGLAELFRLHGADRKAPFDAVINLAARAGV